MRFALSMRQFLAELRAQRLRSALTVLGITWGTVAVVVLLAFGAGFERATRANLSGMGDGIAIVFGGRTTKPFEGYPEGRSIRLREADVRLLEQNVAELAAISVEYGGRVAPVRRGTELVTPYITGVDPAYGAMRNILPEPGGRFLNEPDQERRRRVVVLGDEVNERLFGDADPVGEQVLVGAVPFTVVGVMRPKPQGSSYSARDSDRVFMPASTYRAIFGATALNNLVYLPRDPDRAAAAQDRVYETLGRRHRFDPADRDALMVWDTSEFASLVRYIFLGLNVFLGIVGSFTLTVGGIGVANIMYIVVRERTPEIGVKRSVGARRRDIMGQFLAEAALLVALGATLGLLVSVGLVKLLAVLPIPDAVGHPTLSAGVVAVTVALLAAISLLAGLFPARRAARLDPMDCLRQTGV